MNGDERKGEEKKGNEGKERKGKKRGNAVHQGIVLATSRDAASRRRLAARFPGRPRGFPGKSHDSGFFLYSVKIRRRGFPNLPNYR